VQVPQAGGDADRISVSLSVPADVSAKSGDARSRAPLRQVTQQKDFFSAAPALPDTAPQFPHRREPSSTVRSFILEIALDARLNRIFQKLLAKSKAHH
jgi:hypothetical protein